MTTFWNKTICYHCEQDVVKAYSWGPGTGLLSNNPISRGTEVYGTHGATSSLSSNGSCDGILWEIEATNHSNSGPAVLHAYKATNLATELYTSDHAGGRDTAGPAVKFSVPTVVVRKNCIGQFINPADARASHRLSSDKAGPKPFSSSQW